MSIVFSDSLKTGNQLIDEQHKELIDRVNGLARASIPGSEMRSAVGMLDYLMDYVEYHFQAEEALQEETGYPGLKEHRRLHHHFVQAVTDLQEMLLEEEGPSQAFVEAVKNNVEDWLVYHISVCDKAVADHVKSSISG